MEGVADKSGGLEEETYAVCDVNLRSKRKKSEKEQKTENKQHHVFEVSNGTFSEGSS